MKNSPGLILLYEAEWHARDIGTYFSSLTFFRGRTVRHRPLERSQNATAGTLNTCIRPKQLREQATINSKRFARKRRKS